MPTPTCNTCNNPWPGAPIKFTQKGNSKTCDTCGRCLDQKPKPVAVNTPPNTTQIQGGGTVLAPIIGGQIFVQPFRVGATVHYF